MAMPIDRTSSHHSHPFWLEGVRRVEAALFCFEKWLCMVALGIMMLSIFITILIRNFNLPWPNFGEWALASMIPLTFVGAALCTHLGSHISIDAIKLANSEAIRRLSQLVAATASAIFAGFFTYSGFFVLQEVWISGERMLELGTPLAIPTLAVPLGMMLMFVHSACNILFIFVREPR